MDKRLVAEAHVQGCVWALAQAGAWGALADALRLVHKAVLADAVDAPVVLARALKAVITMLARVDAQVRVQRHARVIADCIVLVRTETRIRNE